MKVNFDNRVDNEDSCDDSTDDMNCLEQRPFSPPEKSKRHKKKISHAAADSKNYSSSDLPL